MERETWPTFDLFPRITKAANFIKSIVFNTNVPLSSSNHYVREHFTDEPVQPPVTVPAKKWEQ